MNITIGLDLARRTAHRAVLVGSDGQRVGKPRSVDTCPKALDDLTDRRSRWAGQGCARAHGHRVARDQRLAHPPRLHGGVDTRGAHELSTKRSS